MDAWPVVLTNWLIPSLNQIVGGVTFESTRQEEGSQEIPETPEDIFRKLHNWDKEPTDWWTSTKKKRDYEEWMKPMKEGTIRRVSHYIDPRERWKRVL